MRRGTCSTVFNLTKKIERTPLRETCIPVTMAFFSSQQLAELSEVNRIRNEAKEHQAKEDAIPYTLSSMLKLIKPSAFLC